MDTYLSKVQTNAIRGVAACMIVVAHYVNRINTTSTGLTIPLINKIGRYGVVIFFICSGYGLMESYKKDSDLNGFWSKRLKSVLLPYWLIQFLSLSLLFEAKVSERGCNGLIQWFSGIEHWYILVSILLYFGFWLSAKIAKNHLVLGNIVGATLINLILILCQAEDYWYMSNYTFILGILVSVYKEKLYELINLKTMTVSGVLFAMSSVIYAKLSYIYPIYFVGKNLAAIFWGILVLHVLKYLPVKNKILQSLGTCSLFIYVIHVNVLEYLEINNIEDLGILGISLCFVFAVAILLNFLYMRVAMKRK